MQKIIRIVKAAENPELSCCKVTERELLKRLEKYSNGRDGNKRGATDEHGNVCKNYVHRVRGCILCD